MIFDHLTASNQKLEVGRSGNEASVQQVGYMAITSCHLGIWDALAQAACNRVEFQSL